MTIAVFSSLFSVGGPMFNVQRSTFALTPALTPALSPGEREKRAQALGEIRRADRCHRLFAAPVGTFVPRSINTTTFAARDFWPRRGASDEHTLQRSVRSEQRGLGQKKPPPGGLRRFSVLASLLLGHSPTAGDASSSRLARTEKRRNKRGRINGTGYLGRTGFQPSLLAL